MMYDMLCWILYWAIPLNFNKHTPPIDEAGVCPGRVLTTKSNTSVPGGTSGKANSLSLGVSSILSGWGGGSFAACRV